MVSLPGKWEMGMKNSGNPGLPGMDSLADIHGLLIISLSQSRTSAMLSQHYSMRNNIMYAVKTVYKITAIAGDFTLYFIMSLLGINFWHKSAKFRNSTEHMIQRRSL